MKLRRRPPKADRIVVAVGSFAVGNQIVGRGSRLPASHPIVKQHRKLFISERAWNAARGVF